MLLCLETDYLALLVCHSTICSHADLLLEENKHHRLVTLIHILLTNNDRMRSCSSLCRRVLLHHKYSLETEKERLLHGLYSLRTMHLVFKSS